MKIKSLIVSFILTASIVCGLFDSTIVVKANDDLMETSTYSYISQDSVLRNGAINNAPSFEEERVTCINSEKVIYGITETFDFVCTTEIDDVVAVGDVSLCDFEINGTEIICTLSDFVSDGSIILEFYYESVLIDRFALYFASFDSNTFYSSAFSLDVAKRNAGITLDYELVSDEETEDVSDYDEDVRLLGIGASGSFSGTFNWTDDQGVVHPLIGAKIEVKIDGSWWTGTTYTDQYGCYSISYSDIWYIGSGNPTVTVYADNGESVYVTYDGTYSKSKDFSEHTGDFSYIFSPNTDGDIGKAMIIFQAAKCYADYAKALNGGTPVGTCGFYYPEDPNEISRYVHSEGLVKISSAVRDSIYVPHSYSSWDVIGHEYGHYIQHYFEIEDNPGGRHKIHSNNIDDQYKTTGTDGTKLYNLEQSKERGLKLAWAEGWATYWSTVAQSTFSNEIKTIWTVGDTSYTAYNGVDYDLDCYDTANSYGDADEVAVQRILYKLYTSTTDTYDKFAISSDALWNIVIDKKPLTFYEFINDLYDAGYNKYNLGILLAEYNVITDSLNISNDYLDECPTFSWSTYKGSSNFNYNSFDLVFINTSGVEILRKTNITTGQYTLTESEWADIISVYGRTYYVYIVARQTDYFTTGNYSSKLFEFAEPDDFNTKVQIKPNEWGFEPQYFFESNKEGHTTTTITDHGLTITTERLRCGYIENSYVILSPKRENAGLAYLELTFDQPVYSYMFGITLWSNNEGLNSSTCTAVVEIMDENGNWTVDFDLFNDLPNGFSVRTQQVDRYEVAHPEGIYGIRFVMTAPATGDRNKGRLCIDDIVLNTDPNDLWFISTFYE